MRAGILRKLEDAKLPGDFESVAALIDAESVYDSEIITAFPERLQAGGIETYPRRLCDYVLRIMWATE